MPIRNGSFTHLDVVEQLLLKDFELLYEVIVVLHFRWRAFSAVAAFLSVDWLD